MIISISGKIGSGKDTIGNIIRYLVFKSKGYDDYTFDHWNDPKHFYEKGRETYSGWQIKKFAYKVKLIASILTGIPVERFEDQEFKKTHLPEEWHEFDDDNHYLEPITVRELLQRIGTEAIRDQIHPNAWVNALFADYKAVKIYPKTSKTGLQKEGLARMIKPNWIITDTRFPNEANAVKERGGINVRVTRPFKSDMHGQHPSETALDNYKAWDYIIDNNGTIEDLIKKVEEILIKEKII